MAALATRSANGNMKSDMLKGLAAGGIGVWAMDKVGWMLYDQEGERARQQEQEARIEGMDPAHLMARRMMKPLGMEERVSEQPNPAGIAIHYALGMLPAALYSTVLKRNGQIGVGRGLLYGLTLFLVLDELTTPALGLANKPDRYPWQAHARGLVSHLALGVVTYTALRLMGQIGSPSRA